MSNKQPRVLNEKKTSNIPLKARHLSSFSSMSLWFTDGKNSNDAYILGGRKKKKRLLDRSILRVSCYCIGGSIIGHLRLELIFHKKRAESNSQLHFRLQEHQ